MGKRGSVAVLAAGLVLAVSGCGGGADGSTGASDEESAKRTPTKPPSKELVEWVGDMCEVSTELATVREDSAKDLKEIRNPDEYSMPPEHLATSYLSRTPWAVEDVERDLKRLDPVGLPAADKLLDAWLKKLRGVLPELDKVSPAMGFEDAEGSAADVDELVQSLTPPKPGLPALRKKDPRLAAAHKRAEQCAPGWKPGEGDGSDSPTPDPTGPLPKAADGKDTGACEDGECEVLVTSEKNITANGVSLHVSLDAEYITFQSGGSVMQLGGGGGEAGFGDELTVNVVALNEDGAVLKFTVP